MVLKIGFLPIKIYMKKIGILGCGWLGKEVGKRLAKHATVLGSTRNMNHSELHNWGIEPFEFSTEQPLANELPTCDAWIIAIPPSGLTHQNGELSTELKSLLKNWRKKTVVYVSSTSVYADENREVVEDEAQSILSPHSGLAQFDVENEIKSILPELTIVRLGGLFGEDRNPVKRLAQMPVLKGAKTLVNLTHKVDAARAIEQIVLKEVKNECYNIVSPEHPSKLQFYSRAAEKYALDLPPAQPEETPTFKIVSSKKFIDQFDFQFTYQNPIDVL